MTALAFKAIERDDAAERVIAAQRDEILSLQADLRDALERLAAFVPYNDKQLHIHIDYGKRTFTLERHFLVKAGVFTDFAKAVEARDALRKQLAEERAS